MSAHDPLYPILPASPPCAECLHFVESTGECILIKTVVSNPQGGDHCWQFTALEPPPPPDGIHPRRCECGCFREVGTVCPRCGRASGKEE